MLVTLEPTTLKGRNRLKEACALSARWDGKWEVREERERVQFSQERGPWLLLWPHRESSEQIGWYLARWVHQTADPHFTVKPL